MKKLITLAMLTLFSTTAFAQSYLKIFMVVPPKPIKWESPKKLFTSTVRNSWYNDYAPNGHYMVNIISDVPNKYGHTSVITGMSRTNKMATMIETIKKGLGMSAMDYMFSGDIDSAEADVHEIIKAKKQDRLYSIQLPISTEKALEMMDFMDDWIRYGAFSRYSGNKNVKRGEGSGCADFATQFIEMALDGHIPRDEWIRSVYLPHNLMGVVEGREDKRVKLLKLFFNKEKWGTSNEDGHLFTTPDPDLMAEWILKKTGGKTKHLILNEENAFETINGYQLEEGSKSDFNAYEANWSELYQEESEEVIESQWQKISLEQPIEELVNLTY
jgi:hypothetical protein